MKKRIISIAAVLFLYLFSTQTNFASTILLRNQNPVRKDMYFTNAMEIPDPTQSYHAIYGYFSTSYAADSYYFISKKSTNVAIEVLVPVRASNTIFKPAWEIVGENIKPQPMNIYFSVPPGSDFIGHDYEVPLTLGPRKIETDPLTMERLFQGNRQLVPVIAGKLYYINVYDPFHYTGDYVLHIGDPNLSKPQSESNVLPQLIRVKTNLTGRSIPIADFVGIYIAIVGMILWFGTIFLSCLQVGSNKKDNFSLQHRSLILFGMMVWVIGQGILYRQSLFSGIAPLQGIIALVILVFVLMLKYSIKIDMPVADENGMQQAAQHPNTGRYLITVVSCLLFCGLEVFLFVWYLLVTR